MLCARWPKTSFDPRGFVVDKIKPNPLYLSDVMTMDYLSPEFLSRLEQLSAPQITKRVAKTTPNKVNVGERLFDNQEVCRFISCKEASQLLSISENALRIMVHRDQIKAHKIGRRLRFKYSDCLALLSQKGESHVY